MILEFAKYINTEPHVDDYVICQPFGISNDVTHTFFDTHIGQINNIEYRNNNTLKIYHVVYDEIIPIEASYDHVSFKENIRHFGTKEEMEIILQTDKYNL